MTAAFAMLALNNGIGMPALGLGVYRSGPQETLSAVSTALAIGYRLLDTAAASRLQLASYYVETYQGKPSWQGF